MLAFCQVGDFSAMRVQMVLADDLSGHVETSASSARAGSFWLVGSVTDAEHVL